MIRFPKIETWQQWCLRLVVVAAAITAILHEVWKSFPDWALTPVLFLAVFAVMVQNEQLLSLARSTTREAKRSATTDSAKLDDVMSQFKEITSGSEALATR